MRDENLREHLAAARFSDDLGEALAALDQIRDAHLYDLILDALSDERGEIRDRAAELASTLLTSESLDLSQLPGETDFSAYFGAAELQAIRDAAKPRGENVAGLLTLLLPRVEGALRDLSEDQLEEAQRQSQPLAKIKLVLPVAVLFRLRLLAWKLDRSPSALLHVVWALGQRLPDFQRMTQPK